MTFPVLGCVLTFTLAFSPIRLITQYPGLVQVGAFDPQTIRLKHPSAAIGQWSRQQKLGKVGRHGQESVLIALFKIPRNAKHRAFSGEIDAKSIVPIPIELQRFREAQTGEPQAPQVMPPGLSRLVADDGVYLAQQPFELLGCNRAALHDFAVFRALAFELTGLP